MVPDIEPEQGHDITGKQRQQRGEKDLRTYQKRQGYPIQISHKLNDPIRLAHRSVQGTPHRCIEQI